jgi:pilus assembly protein CpaC
MTHWMKRKLNTILLLTFCTALLSWPCLSNAQDTLDVINPPSEKLSLISGKSVLLRSSRPVKRISIANPGIADFVLLSPREIYLTGKAAGTTNLMLWNGEVISGVYDLEVGYDVSTLKAQIHEVMPEETGLNVLRMNDTITLTGTVTSAANLAQATALAESFAPKGKVNTLATVGGGSQVMLEVRVAELSKATTKRLGINFAFMNENGFGLSVLSGLTQINEMTNSGVDLNISNAVQAAFSFDAGSTTWTGFIDALQQDGLAKVLAKPTLIAMSGQSASFLAGGEFPVPVPQGLGTAAIEYKSFGVALNFTPIVLSNNRINIQVSPEVSELDFTTAVSFSGFVVPGLTARKASTTIELGDGQSFAIAGLLKDNVRDAIRKFPLLGDIPVLGALFRSREFQKEETELVIVVTPRLVKPTLAEKIALPTDYYVEPNTSQIYLEGVMQGKGDGKQAGIQPGLEGEFGHSLPGE